MFRRCLRKMLMLHPRLHQKLRMKHPSGWVIEKWCPSRQPADILTAPSAQQIFALSQVRWALLRWISEAPHHLSDLLPFMICCCFLAFSSCTYQSLFLTERSKSSHLVSLAQMLRHVGVKHMQRKVHKCKESPFNIGQFSFHHIEREQPPPQSPADMLRIWTTVPESLSWMSWLKWASLWVKLLVSCCGCWGHHFFICYKRKSNHRNRKVRIFFFFNEIAMYTHSRDCSSLLKPLWRGPVEYIRNDTKGPYDNSMWN